MTQNAKQDKKMYCKLWFFSKKYTIHHQKCTYIQTARARSRVRFDTFRTDQSLPWHPLIYISQLFPTCVLFPQTPMFNSASVLGVWKHSLGRKVHYAGKYFSLIFGSLCLHPFGAPYILPSANGRILGESTAFQSAFGYISPLPMADFKHQRAMYFTGNMWRTKDKYH